MNVAAYLKRLDKLESAMGQARIKVVSGPMGGDFSAQIAEKIAAGARRTDLFVCVHRFIDWKPEGDT